MCARPAPFVYHFNRAKVVFTKQRNDILPNVRKMHDGIGAEGGMDGREIDDGNL